MFNKGDLITAVGINEVNNKWVTVMSLGDAGFADWVTLHSYFYSVAAEKDNMVYVSAGNGWGAGIRVYMWKLVNGSWGQPLESFSRDTSIWGPNGRYEFYWPSYGEGYYHVQFQINKRHYTTVQIRNGMVSCKRGEYLKLAPDLSSSSSFQSKPEPQHELITAELLNSGRIYTVEKI